MNNGDHFDVCLVDINMPEMNGYEFTDKVWEMYRIGGNNDMFPVFIAISAQENVKQHPDFRLGQFDETILKPITNVNFLEKYLRD